MQEARPAGEHARSIAMYIFCHIDMACRWLYPAGIDSKTRAHVGDNFPNRNKRPGATQPVPSLGKETSAMQRTATRNYPSARNATFETRRSSCEQRRGGRSRRGRSDRERRRDGVSANGEWRMAA